MSTEQLTAPAMIGDPLDYRTMVELLIKHYGVKDGHFDLMVEFTMGFGSVGPNPENVVPGVMVGLQRLGLTRASEASRTAVDAAQVTKIARLKKKNSPK